MAQPENLDLMDKGLNIRFTAVHHTYPSIDKMRRGPRHKAMHLPEVLEELKLFMATDSRDRVYAALGFTVDADLINVDYRCELKEVLIQACKSWTE